MSKFTVVYDACVLYPAPLRDLLLNLALTNLFKAHWTNRIHEEWINARMRENRFTREKPEHVRELMDRHAGDAKVTGYETLIDAVSLPDPSDHHVVAAAIHCGADAIVTFNRKDFPEHALSPYAIDVLHPDDFVYYQVDMAPAFCCSAIRRQRLSLKHPEVSVSKFLSTLQKQQLPQTVSKLKEFGEFP